jgi:serine/threonine-protein kinase RsbW
MQSGDTERIEITISSRFENIELVQVIAEHLCENAGVDEDGSHWIGMAVREAVANAIKHGNLVDESKRVRIEARVEATEVVVRITDQGPGFDLAEVKDPLAPENLLRPGGRGIFYMRQLMDQVDFRFGEDGGTEVVLKKTVAPRPANSTGSEEEDRAS